MTELSAGASDDAIRILLVGLNYAPEPTGIAPYTSDMAEGLAADGAQVRVVSAFPHYPGWRFADPPPRRSSSTVNGVELERVRHRLPRGSSASSRLVSEISFGLAALRTDWRDAEVVVVVSPALFASVLAIAKAKVLRRRVGIWVQDFYGLGVQETAVGDRFGVAAKIVGAVERWAVRRADGVVVIHEDMQQTALDLGADPAGLAVVRNWSHIAPPLDVARSITREALGWKDGETVILHTGNMGAKQHLENVVEAARLADAQAAAVRFVLMGDGVTRPELERLGTGVQRLSIVDGVSESRYANVLEAADVLLVNEHPGVRGMAVPSKLTSYFASGRPVLAATDRRSLTADEITQSGAGWIIPPSDPAGLLLHAERMMADARAARDLGMAGVRYQHQRLSSAAAIGWFSSWISWLASDRSGGHWLPIRRIGADALHSGSSKRRK